MGDELVTTPTEGVTDTTTTETETVTTTETTQTDNRDWAAELNAKDSDIAELRAQLNSVAGDTEAKNRLAVELAEMITERSNLARERDEAVTKSNAAIDTLTTATESLIDHSGELAKKIHDYEQQIEAEKRTSNERLGKLTKLEVLTKEFQHLLPYADRILNSEDPEKVRADARAFAATRESDLDTFKRVIGGGASQPITTQPTTSEETTVPVDDADARREYLRKSMKNPKEFEAAIENMKSAYNQTQTLAS